LTTRGEGGLLVLGARRPGCILPRRRALFPLHGMRGGRGPAGTTTRRGPGSPRRAPERRVPVSGVTYHRRSTTCTCRSTLAAAPLVLAQLRAAHLVPFRFRSSIPQRAITFSCRWFLSGSATPVFIFFFDQNKNGSLFSHTQASHVRTCFVPLRRYLFRSDDR
jgi:hypothetical protein